MSEPLVDNSSDNKKSDENTKNSVKLQNSQRSKSSSVSSAMSTISFGYNHVESPSKINQSIFSIFYSLYDQV
jgi:hypothetical protein